LRRRWPEYKLEWEKKVSSMCPILKGREGEAILEAAKLMLISARTAPKSGGIDDVLTLIVYGEEKEALVREMERIGKERGIANFKRDAKNVRDSHVVVLVGVKGTKSFGLNCGACGYKNCENFKSAGETMGQDFVGPNCILKVLDLGIALGSAVKTASMLNVDNRVMYRIGVAARRLKMIPEATLILGIPLSATGKNIYFDRK